MLAATPIFAFMANVGSSDVTGTAMGVATVLALLIPVRAWAWLRRGRDGDAGPPAVPAGEMAGAGN
jgi:hypothetical protein